MSSSAPRSPRVVARQVLEIEAAEVSNQATFQSALEELTRRGILAKERPPGARESAYVRGPAFDTLAGLRERLAGSLLDG